MKKSLGILALAMVLVLALGCVSAFAEGGCKVVTFNLSLRQNYLFACYDINVYLDNELVGKLRQGGSLTKTMVLSDETHTLALIDTSGNAYSWTLSGLKNNSVVSGRFQTHELYIQDLSRQIDGRKLSTDTSGDPIPWWVYLLQVALLA